MNSAAGKGDVMANFACREAPLRVAVMYHFWPHYRQAVMQAMDGSRVIIYDFYGSGEPLEGVPHAALHTVARFKRAPFYRVRNLVWQAQAIRVACSGRYDALVMLADPHFVSTWVAASCAKLRRKPVVFWGHGWLRKEHGIQRAIRRLYYALSTRFLTYSERGKALGVAAGHAPDAITVVYNSLDVARADGVIAAIEAGALTNERPQQYFADHQRPLLICTARLTAKCRFDLLITAAALLGQRGTPVNLLLVGEGPEREGLALQAADMGVALHLFGSCHDEEVVGQLLYHSDITVSPGKVGLTAMHSLMYGTPVITHGDLDAQMPEVEAIEAGKTGAFFQRDDAQDLAEVIEQWLRVSPPRPQVRSLARDTIRAKWNPQVQAGIIEAAIMDVVQHG